MPRKKRAAFCRNDQGACPEERHIRNRDCALREQRRIHVLMASLQTQTGLHLFKYRVLSLLEDPHIKDLTVEDVVFVLEIDRDMASDLLTWGQNLPDRRRFLFDLQVKAIRSYNPDPPSDLRFPPEA